MLPEKKCMRLGVFEDIFERINCGCTCAAPHKPVLWFRGIGSQPAGENGSRARDPSRFSADSSDSDCSVKEGSLSCEMYLVTCIL